MTVPEHEWIDAGHGVQFWVWTEEGTLYFKHPCPVLGDSAGAIPLDVPQNDHVGQEHKWQVESWDPITLSPSLQCVACPHHGFIRGGRWEPC